MLALLLVGVQAVGQTLKLEGHIRNSTSGEAIQGANVFVKNLNVGVTTDSTGYFVLFLPSGSHTVHFSFVGFEDKTRNISLNRPLSLNVVLEESTQLLQEINVTGQSEDHNVSSAEIGVSKMSIKTIEQMPSFMGEVDVMKSLLMLPGVSTVGEGTTGLNVRGGNIDQNLILLDDAPVFNSSHLMGLFSVFNPDMVNDVTFYRGAIPAQYGSRVSSVLDIKIRNPETEGLKVQGGVGLISNRLMLEGPIATERLSFLIGGRASFSDYLLNLSPNESIRDTKANFYDVTGKLVYRINDNNKLQLSFYRAHDGFKLASDSLSAVEINASSSEFNWETANGTLRWDHAFSQNFIANIVGVYSDYSAIIRNPEVTNGFDLSSSVKYRKVKSDFHWFSSGGHAMMFGAAAINYTVNPGHLLPTSDESNVNELLLQKEQGVELSAFVSDEITLSDKFTVMLGLRYSYYQARGPRRVYMYQVGEPRTLATISDTIVYDRGEKIAAYHGPEPRFSFKYSLNPSNSIKLGYNRMRQYLQLVSNTTAALPVDRWQLANAYSEPIIADQISLGYFKNLHDNMYEVSGELFYKRVQNATDYKDGAELLLNEALETAILQGEGYAHGLELQTKKNRGRLTGWLSYTYSQSKQLISGNQDEERINAGEYYPTNFNKPHILNMSATWKESARVSFSANFTYSSGRPVTYPDDKYYVYGLYIPNYVSRNQYKIPDYHRLDLAVMVEPNPANARKWKGSWTFSLYNVYARKNAYSVFFKPNNQSHAQYLNHANAYKLSIFGTIFPSVTYNFSF